MTSWSPLIIGITFIIVVLVVSEFVDRNRKKHKGDVPSSALERREKMSPYIMPTGMKVKPSATYSGNPDYSLPVPESLDDDVENNRRR